MVLEYASVFHTHRINTRTHTLSRTHQLQIALDCSLDGSSGGRVRVVIKARKRGEEGMERREGERRER